MCRFAQADDDGDERDEDKGHEQKRKQAKRLSSKHGDLAWLQNIVSRGAALESQNLSILLKSSTAEILSILEGEVLPR